MTLHEVLGSAGAVLIVGAYFLLQVQKLDPKGLTYSLVNALGAGAIVTSLTVQWNLSAFLVEAFWFAVSVFGIWRWMQRRSTATADSNMP